MLNEKQREQVMLSQGKAVSVEWILRRIFDCEQLGFGGQVKDVDFEFFICKI